MRISDWSSDVCSSDLATPLNRALELIDFSAQEGLGHGITPEDFSILTLQLFAGRLCANRDDAFGCFRVDWSQRKFLRYFMQPWSGAQCPGAHRKLRATLRRRCI